MRLSTYVMMVCILWDMIWHNFNNDALVSFSPRGILVPLNCAFLNEIVKVQPNCFVKNGRVKDVRG